MVTIGGDLAMVQKSRLVFRAVTPPSQGCNSSVLVLLVMPGEEGLWSICVSICLTNEVETLCLTLFTVLFRKLHPGQNMY